MPKGDQARDEILTAAKRLFLSRGYGSTSMRDIAQEAGGRAVAGIYNHFPSKEAIFTALLEANFPNEALDALETVEGSTAPEILRDLLAKVLPMMQVHYEFFELMQIDTREFDRGHIQQILMERVIPQVLAAIYRLGNVPGLKPIEPPVLMRLVVSVLVGYLLTERFGPGVIIKQIPTERWIAAYSELITYGLCRTDVDSKGKQGAEDDLRG